MPSQDDSPVSLGAADRRALLDRCATEQGRFWARGLRKSLLEEGRRIAGGWPGTLSEARSRAVTVCARALRNLGKVPPSCAEIDWMARRLNAAARLDWLAKAEREEPSE